MAISIDKIADLRVKQLEIVQGIVGRVASNEANLKNYCITLTTAICGFAITLQRPLVTVSTIVPIIVFAFLDAQLLRVERRFRRLFDQLRQEDWQTPPSFAIDLEYAPPIAYLTVLASWSILIFYIPLAIAVLGIFLISTNLFGQHV